jgi:hypothetical protein
MRSLSTIFLIYFGISFIAASAQPSLGSWQWAKKAGGVNNTSASNREHELVQDMCTDKYGNVYTTGSVYLNSYFEGIQYTAPFASFGGRDAFVAKYDKCGNLKWVRFGGGTAYDAGMSMHGDDSLKAYMVGTINSLSATFPDSTQALSVSHPGVFWAKYDSAGNIKWVKASNSGHTFPLAKPKLSLKQNGHLSTVLLLGIGAFYPGFNFTSTHAGNAIFEFDLNGNPINILRIDSFSASSGFSNVAFSDMAYDMNGDLVLAYFAFDTIHFFDTIFYSPSGDQRAFLIKVNHQTNDIKWTKEWVQDNYKISGFGELKIDEKNNIIVNAFGGKNSVFNGDSIKLISNTNGTMALFKLDSNGNTIWRDIELTSANYMPPAITFCKYDADHYCIPIVGAGTTYWGWDTIISPNGRYPYYITLVNATTGKVEYKDSISRSSNLNSHISITASDEQGNVYLGGYFSSTLAAGPTTIMNTGGIDDAFVMKWGVQCSDSFALIAPLAAEDMVANPSGAHAIDVDWRNVAMYADQYRIYRSATDSTSGYTLTDSVNKYQAHYTDVNVVPNQVYWYRVAAVNHAGETYSNADSASIRTVGVVDITTIKHIALYPNPANDHTELSIWNDALTSVPISLSVIDLEGREFYSRLAVAVQGKNDFMMDFSAIGAGIYICNIQTGSELYSKKLAIVR